MGAGGLAFADGKRAIRRFGASKNLQGVRFLCYDSSPKTYIVPANIALRQAEELVAFGARLHDFLKRQVHVGVALDQVAVERFAVLQLDEHWVALGGCEKAER